MSRILDTPAITERVPQSGTPLARIVAGVFLGLLAWTVLMGIVFAILAATALNQVEDAFAGVGGDPAITEPELSTECQNALIANSQDREGIACMFDEPAAIDAYLARNQ